MLRDKRILLGVTGGIAAYKAVQLLRDFQSAGADVRVLLTPNATRFIGAETFHSLTGGYTATHIFQEKASNSEASETWVKHVQWAEWADLFLIAPCTANTLSKIAHGAADNLLTTTLLASRCPVLLCPTMDGHMYESPATKNNLKKVRQYGYHILEPEFGFLASGMEGKGRLPERSAILSTVDNLLEEDSSDASRTNQRTLLEGQRVVVTAGPTREPIDPVRFISNPSSGKMGVAMAEAADQLGADVILIHGPITVDIPAGISTIPITTAQELHREVRNQEHIDTYILAAAVSDFAPEKTHDQKVKKDQAESTIKLKPTPDTLQWLGNHKKGEQTLIGFAMESENVLENAKIKKNKKKADWIIANSITGGNSGFASDQNSVTVVGPDTEVSFEGAKRDIAYHILREIFGNSASHP